MPSSEPRHQPCTVRRLSIHRTPGRLLATIAIGTVIAASPAGTRAAGSVPTFDPDATTVLDMRAGSERPDQRRVLAALEAQYESFDTCVMNARPRRDAPIAGNVRVQILLDPSGATPLGINAELPPAARRDVGLRECLRDAVSRADYPEYDGPPVVVVVEFELDPGETEVP